MRFAVHTTNCPPIMFKSASYTVGAAGQLEVHDGDGGEKAVWGPPAWEMVAESPDDCRERRWLPFGTAGKVQW